MNQQFRNIVYLADRSGTGKWRRVWPIQSVDCVAQSLNIQADYSQTPIVDQNYYKGLTSVTVQRWISDSQRDMFCKFFKPIMDANCGWLIYEIDDCMLDSEIPKFNRGRKAFEGDAVQNNIRQMLNAADFVTVTTDYIKTFYHEHYGVPLENILAVPNLLPKFLFGGRYNPAMKLEQFRKNKIKPRIGIVSSLSHYNVDGVREDQAGLVVRRNKRSDGTEVWINERNQEVPFEQTHEITDDIDEIIDCIRSTVNDFQWVFFGFCPPKLQDLAKTGKIEVHGGVPIMNYPGKFADLGLQVVVAPIKDMVFNRCKSFIKYMECAALGIPLLASDYLPYNRVMPKDQLFKTGDDLKQKLMQLKFASSHIYSDMIERQWKWFNTSCNEGDFRLKNFWLEDNLNIYIDMFRLRQKSIKVSMNSFLQQYEQRKKTEADKIIFNNDNITITK